MQTQVQSTPLTEQIDAWCGTTAEDIPLYLWPSEIFELIDFLAESEPEAEREQFKAGLLEALAKGSLKVNKHTVRIRYGKNEAEATPQIIG